MENRTKKKKKHLWGENTEEMSVHLSTYNMRKFFRMAKHKGTTSGNTNSPFKPKPIRILMQTCRVYFVVYFPF